MSYDGFYGELSSRGTANDALNQIVTLKDKVVALAADTSASADRSENAAAIAEVKATEAINSAASALTSKESAEISEISAGLSAQQAAIALVATSRFCGVSAIAPSTRLDGSALQQADEWYNSVDNLYYSWNGTAWVDLKSSAQQLEERLARPDGLSVSGFIEAEAFATARTALDKMREMTISPDDFSGVDDEERLERALNTGKPVLLNRAINITRTHSVTSLRLVGAGGSITGGNFLGFSCSGSIEMAGDMTISGFGDGTEDQKTNYNTAFCRIPTGSKIDHIWLGKGVKARDCRALITAGALGSDIMADKTIEIGHFHSELADYRRVMQVAMLRCVTRKATGAFNNTEDCIGASRVVGGFLFYLDGLGAGDPAYAKQGTQTFIGDTFKNIINRTTTGDSSTGNNYESHAYMLYGQGAFITDPDCEDVTGTRFDCEAIYSKTKSLYVRGGRFKNCGTEEGAIVAKGAALDADVTGNAKGGITDIRGSVIEFDRYEYDNNGTIVPLVCRGVTVAATYDAYVDVRVIGANADADVRLDGYLNTGSTIPSKNAGCVIKVESERSKSGGAVIARGAFHDLDIWARAVDVACVNRNWATIRYHSISGRGFSNRNHNYWHHTQMNNPNMSGFDICGVQIDNDSYDIKGLSANDCLWDVVAPGAIIKPVSLKATSSSPVGLATDLQFKDWKFLQPLTSVPFVVDGVFKPKSYEIDFNFQVLLTDNTTVTAAQACFYPGSSGVVSVEGFLTRLDSIGHGILQPKISQLFYESGGVATSVGAAASSPAVGDMTASTSIALSPSGVFARARINGNDNETYKADLRFTAKIVSA